MTEPTEVPVTDKKDCLHCKAELIEIYHSVQFGRFRQAITQLDALIEKVGRKSE